MSKKKHGFILKMFPGDKKSRERKAVILIILMFAVTATLLIEIKNNFYSEASAESFTERVANTKAK